MYTTGKLTFTPHGGAIASHDPDEPYLPHAGSLSPENAPDPEPGVSEEEGPLMTVTVFMRGPFSDSRRLFDVVAKMLQYNHLWPHGEGGFSVNEKDEYVLRYPDDEWYRDLDRFLDHCQAIGLIRDWKIER